MKKTLLLAGVAVSMFAINVNAVEFKPYVGVDYTYTSASTNDVMVEETYLPSEYYEDSFNSFTLNIGAKFNKNLGAEVFYQKSSAEEGQMIDLIDTDGDVIASDKIETSFNAYGIDAQGYYSINENVELIGSLGLGKYDFEMEGFGYSASEDGLGYRIGVGAQYNISENVAVRGLVRRVILNTDSVDDLTEASIGVKYTF